MAYYNKQPKRDKYSSIYAFDLETIPDIDLIKYTYPELESLDDPKDITDWALNKYEKERGIRFLPPIFHKIIAIGLCSFSVNNGFKFNVGYVGDMMPNDPSNAIDEKYILVAFNQLLTKQPTIVSFNGSGFDIPVIQMRSAKYEVQQSNLMNKDNKFENYLYPYSDMHTDLFMEFGGRGKASSLDLMTKQICGVGKSEDVNGADIYHLYYDNKPNLIKKYVSTDVFITMSLFVKYMKMALNSSDASLKDFISSGQFLEQIYKEYIKQYE